MPLLLRHIMLTLTLLLASGSAVQAHAQLQGSNPPAEAVVQVLPTEVILRFSEPAAPLVLQWLLPDGRNLDATGLLRGDDLVITAVDAGQGSYVLNWRVASTDGHPVSGALVFAVGAPSRGAVDAIVEAASARWAAAGRFALSLLLVISVGAAVYGALVAPLAPGIRRLACGAGGLALPVAALALGLHGLDMLGQGPLDLFAPRAWQAAVNAPIARSLALGAVAAVFALVGIIRRNNGFAVVAWGVAALSFAASGHAAEAPPRWISGPAIALHALALIYWLGALMPLLGAVRRPGAARQLTRFSGIAVPMVVVLIGSGLALTILQARSLTALLASDWGTILAAKLVLVAGLLALAAWNRLRLTPAIASGATGVRLTRSIMAEIVLSVAILALASAFRLTPPPRLVPESRPVFAHVMGPKAMADLRISPGRAGQNTVSLNVMDGSGEMLVPLEVQLSFTDTARGTGPILATAHLMPDGLWQTDPVTLPGTGPWQVTLSILISDFAKATLTEQILLSR